jgi:hypothetical protein
MNEIELAELPEGRGKMNVAYDPSGAVIICGGGARYRCYNFLNIFSENSPKNRQNICVFFSNYCYIVCEKIGFLRKTPYFDQKLTKVVIITLTQGNVCTHVSPPEMFAKARF